jgi:hypothetical protein
MQAIIWRATRRRECFTTSLAAITPPSALSSDVIRMTNDVAPVELAAEAAGWIGTAARRASSDFHTCLMTEETREVQEFSDVPGIADDCQQHFPGEAPEFYKFNGDSSDRVFGRDNDGCALAAGSKPPRPVSTRPAASVLAAEPKPTEATPSVAPAIKPRLVTMVCRCILDPPATSLEAHRIPVAPIGKISGVFSLRVSLESQLRAIPGARVDLSYGGLDMRPAPLEG